MTIRKSRQELQRTTQSALDRNKQNEPIQSKEGSVAGEESDPGDDLENLYTPEEHKILQQEIELLNGTKMPQADARAEYGFLCRLYEEEPELFHALVVLVKHLPDEIKPEIRTVLRDRRCIRGDGLVRDDLAAVLDAAYQPESPDSIPLRYPIRHASREQADQISKIYDQAPGTEIPRRFLRHIFGEDNPGDESTPAR